MARELQEPLDALEELELLVKSCQEDLCQSVANARRALLACGGKICLDGGMGQVGGDEHPALKIPGIKIDERGDVPSVTWASVEKISAVEKTSQPSLTPWVDQELPLHSQDMEAFQRSHETSDYPFTSDTGDVPEAQAICNSIQSLRLPPQSPTSSSHGSNLPPMAPENTGRTTKDRRSSKSSTAHDPSSVHYMPSEMRVSGHMRREKLDTVIGIVVLLNSLTMAMELECEGQVAGERVGMPELLQCHHHISFYIAEHVFTIIFVLELAWRVYWLRWRYFLEVLNVVDAFLAMYSFIYVYVLTMLLQSVNLQLLRLLRLAKLVRAIRIMRTLRLFRGLRLLVHACFSFLPSLAWSMALLSLCILTAGLVIGNLLHEFILDETKEFEQRLWIWIHYGTAYRAIWTMYEMTFAGNWPQSARPVLESVSHGYCVFFLLYITVIVFAVLRVITAIFVKETLEVASNDAELMVQERMRKKASYVKKLESIFKAMDDSGDGLLSEEEMSEWLLDERVQAYLESLDIDAAEGEALFRLLANDDGEITYQDFIAGILRCKGSARAIDQLILHNEVERVGDQVANLAEALEKAKVIPSSEKKKRVGRLMHQMTLFQQANTTTFENPVLRTASIK
ncbi:unnamed protein product [Durusdinium trenchii]|uniref:EF-hand domain-containing protein n=2 Tax=Durusdinium trenchii TaxID=1381693 RepID=A0ABP0KM15_9DINO